MYFCEQRKKQSPARQRTTYGMNTPTKMKDSTFEAFLNWASELTALTSRLADKSNLDTKVLNEAMVELRDAIQNEDVT